MDACDRLRVIGLGGSGLVGVEGIWVFKFGGFGFLFGIFIFYFSVGKLF